MAGRAGDGQADEAAQAVSAPTVVVLDYGSGNIRSAVRALQRVGAGVELTAEPARVAAADGLFVPGVGAYSAVMAGLKTAGAPAMIDRRLAGGRPVLGVCVGLQVLFTAGVEHEVRTEGLGQWPGTVERLRAPIVPHMGWSTVRPPQGSDLFAGIADERFYFVHSYAAHDAPDYTRITWSRHGDSRFVAAVENGALRATQFHPEKSGDAGAELLRNWLATF